LPDDYKARIGVPAGMENRLFLSDDDYLLKNDSQIKDWWDKVFKA
jgi:hypothetical protein